MGYINDQGEYVNESRGGRGSNSGNSNGNIFVRMTKFIIVKNDDSNSETINQRSTLIAGLILFMGVITGISMLLKGNMSSGILAIILSLATAFLYEFIARKKGLLTFLVFATLFYIGFETGGDIITALLYGLPGWVIGMGLEKLNNIKYRK